MYTFLTIICQGAYDYIMKIDEAGKISDKVVALLKQERQRQSISCYKLAKGCGLSKTSIAYIEKNENKPTLRTLVMIADKGYKKTEVPL